MHATTTKTTATTQHRQQVIQMHNNMNTETIKDRATVHMHIYEDQYQMKTHEQPEPNPVHLTQTKCTSATTQDFNNYNMRCRNTYTGQSITEVYSRCTR